MLTHPEDALVERLCASIAPLGSALVAYSGGIDSTLVLALAARALGRRALGLSAVSPSVSPAEARAARALAERLGIEVLFLETHELSRPGYVANGSDRCFHCKTELYAACREVARQRGLAAILNGTNADDPGDWRPGLRAADAAGVISPLLAAGLGKQAVRTLARRLDLPNWDKPALACLASRLPYGTRVTPERLAAVDAVERWLRARGFRDVRARHHGELVRLEVEAERVPELEALAAGAELPAIVRAAGFERLLVEQEGYRSGRLNDMIGSDPARSAP